MKPRGGEEGFTLLELIISLGLFTLIAVAGLGLLVNERDAHLDAAHAVPSVFIRTTRPA